MPYRRRSRSVPTGLAAKRAACEELYRLGLLTEEIAVSMDMRHTPVERILTEYRQRTSGIERPFTPEAAYVAQITRFVQLWPDIPSSVIDRKASRFAQNALYAYLQIEFYTSMLSMIVWSRYIESGVETLTFEAAGGEALECLFLYLGKIRHKTIPVPKSTDAFRDALINQYFWNDRIAKRNTLSR